MRVKGLFNGKFIGRRTAKMWNHNLKSSRFTCFECHAQCGNGDELMSHYKKYHESLYNRMVEIRKNETSPTLEAA